MKNGNKPINPLSDLGFPSHESVIEEKCIIGLTKREYFAGLAMQGLLANFKEHGHYDNSEHHPIVAKLAVQCADELLKELEKEGE